MSIVPVSSCYAALKYMSLYCYGKLCIFTWQLYHTNLVELRDHVRRHEHLKTADEMIEYFSAAIKIQCLTNHILIFLKKQK